MALHRSAQGKMIDMAKLAQKHELTPAVGNAKVNARGDTLGPGGKIVKNREDVVSSYYKPAPTKPGSQAVSENIATAAVVAPAAPSPVTNSKSAKS